ncbi:MAG: sigma-70 family RNA polymerase sigma factor [Gemmatimonadetes bacterium]|nr:sigma-70 family RNA polymerase sigma factor [Gemmatimonadota bacterium]
MPSAASPITSLLHRWSEGDSRALDQLVPIVYDSLRLLARQRLQGAPAERSLNTTALVHEAYIRLVDVPKISLRDRSHFLSLASRVMRCLLADHARARMAAKRGGGAAVLELREGTWMADEDLDSVVELDEALKRLEAMDPRQSQILEQRYFGGLSLEETAEAMGLSLATVKRELRSARAWLLAELKNEPSL